MNFNFDYSLPVSLTVILDLVAAAVILLCAWRGWRKGIIGGICAVLAIVVAFYGANLIASTYSAEFTGIIEPFANGIVDTMLNKVTGKSSEDTESAGDETPPDASDGFDAGEETEEKKGLASRPTVVELSEEEKKDVYSVAFAVLRQVGFHEDTAASIAKSASDFADYVNSDLSEFLAEKLCSVLAYIGVFVIAFILIVILFAVVGNVIDLVFNLPGIELVNKILGLALGLAEAFCILQFIGCVARFTGILIPDAAIDGTLLFKYFVEQNYLVTFIGL